MLVFLVAAGIGCLFMLQFFFSHSCRPKAEAVNGCTLLDLAIFSGGKQKNNAPYVSLSATVRQAGYDMTPTASWFLLCTWPL